MRSTEDFKTEAAVKSAGDVVIGAGINQDFSAIYRSCVIN